MTKANDHAEPTVQKKRRKKKRYCYPPPPSFARCKEVIRYVWPEEIERSKGLHQ